MIALYKIPYSFGFIMGCGIVKEYGGFNFLYKWLKKPHKESKDADDLTADFLGASLGYFIGHIVY